MRKIRYFEEIEVGEEDESLGMTVTDYPVMQFAGLSCDFFELHTNDEFAKKTQFGKRVAHGLLGLALTDGLKNRTEFQIHAIASSHWSCDVVRPIFIGDTLHVRFRVTDKKESRTKLDRGVVTLELELINQRGETVQQGQNSQMVSRRPVL
jgi:acyl dehydratase